MSDYNLLHQLLFGGRAYEDTYQSYFCMHLQKFLIEKDYLQADKVNDASAIQIALTASLTETRHKSSDRSMDSNMVILLTGLDNRKAIRSMQREDVNAYCIPLFQGSGIQRISCGYGKVNDDYVMDYSTYKAQISYMVKVWASLFECKECTLEQKALYNLATYLNDTCLIYGSKSMSEVLSSTFACAPTSILSDFKPRLKTNDNFCLSDIEAVGFYVYALEHGINIYTTYDIFRTYACEQARDSDWFIGVDYPFDILTDIVLGREKPVNAFLMDFLTIIAVGILNTVHYVPSTKEETLEGLCKFLSADYDSSKHCSSTVGSVLMGSAYPKPDNAPYFDSGISVTAKYCDFPSFKYKFYPKYVK